MKDLIAKLEAATEETQHIVIYDVLVWLHKNEHISDGVYDQAMRFRNAGAYLDATMMLVPVGRYCRSQIDRDGAAWFWVEGKDNEFVAYSKSPALALCIAALKARESQK